MIELFRLEFNDLEKKHFDIINNYIKGVITKDEYKDFATKLLAFRAKLDNYVPKEDEILEIAKMKSRIQHFNTDTIEDEDVLSSLF